eukprot:TRINITY_DN149_c0_g1_i2.p1 TRINITY_DN149_c0_g1~~TRINITY_DN149_c0_g1_i2.p1  ORF type:complete len:211 (-),score=78.82 TRINITY_DN149_c0_g1_i2:125-757(-)
MMTTHSFFSEYSDEEDEEEVKGGIFDEWYQDLFAEQMGYKQEMDTLYRNKKTSALISAGLYDLLHDGILVKNPEERMDIDELMTHTWFESVHEMYTKNIIIVNDEHKKLEIDVYDGIMNDDMKIAELLHITETKLLQLHQLELNAIQLELNIALDETSRELDVDIGDYIWNKENDTDNEQSRLETNELDMNEGEEGYGNKYLNKHKQSIR